MANATPQEIAAIYANALGRTNVDAEGLAYWSSKPLSDLIGTVQGITGKVVDTATLSNTNQASGYVSPGAETARTNAAAVDPGYSTAGYDAGSQSYTPPTPAVAATPTAPAQPAPVTGLLGSVAPVASVAAGNPQFTQVGAPAGIPPKTLDQTKMQSAIDYMHSLNPLIRAAQDKEHGAGTPDTFQITPGAGKTVASELVKWNNMDKSIDPAYAQMFNDMNGWYMKGNENLAPGADGTQMVPGSQWINNPTAASNLMQSFSSQMAQDKQPGLLQKALPALIAAAAIYASGPAGAGWWGSGASSELTGSQLKTLMDSGFSTAEISSGTGLSTSQLTSLLSAPGSAAAEIAAKTGASIGDVAKGLTSGYTAAQLAGMTAGAIGVLAAGGLGNTTTDKTTTITPWTAQQPFLTDMFGKAQTASNLPAETQTQIAARQQADAVRQSIMSQNSSQGYGMQKTNGAGAPTVDVGAVRNSLLPSTPNTGIQGQVTQDAYANNSLLPGGQPRDAVTQSIFDMYAANPTAKQYNPNGPDQAAIDYWKGKIETNGLSAVQNTIFPQQVTSTASGQPPTTEGMASTAPQTGGSFGPVSNQYSQTLANANINPYSGAQVTPGKIDPLANNAFLGQTTAPTTNAFIGQTVAPTDNSYIGQKTNVGTNTYLGQDNPFLQKMVDYASQDIANAWLPETMRMQRQSGAFGNSGLDQQRQKELLLAQGRSADTLRFQDYSNQQQLSESDVARKAAADAADLARNTNAMQGQQQFNANLSQADLSRNLTATQNQGQFNANLSQADTARNAALQQQINQANAGIQGQNISNLTAAQQSDLARNSEIWNAGANRDLAAYQFNLNQQLNTANGTAGNTTAEQANIWNPVLNYNRAITGGVNGGTSTTPVTTNPLTAGLSAAYTGYKLFGG